MHRNRPPARVFALRNALHRAQTVGPFSIPLAAGLGSGFLASFLVDAILFERLGTPWRQLVDAAAFAAVAAPVWIGVQHRDVRRAQEVLTWLNGWEMERWEKEVGRRLPAVPRATPEILDSLPDTMGLRPLRVELLAVRGELREAEARLDALPTDTPWQRFERAALDEWISWLHGGHELLDPMRAAAEEIDDTERALVARTMVAAAEARRAAVADGDAIGPLAAVRDDLGGRPGRYAFPHATGIVISVVLVGVIASLAVTVTAAIIR